MATEQKFREPHAQSFIEAFRQGYRRKVRSNYRGLRAQTTSKQGVIFTPYLNRRLHSNAFFAGVKAAVQHIGYQVRNLFNYKFDRKPLARKPIHPEVSRILNQKKKSPFKRGQEINSYRKIELSVNRQVQLNKPKNRLDRKIIAKAKRINIVRKVLNKIEQGFEKLISFAPASVRNAYGKFKSGVRKEFIRSYRNKIREEVAKESDRVYRAVDRKMSKYTTRNIVIEMPNRPTVRRNMGPDEMVLFKKAHTKRVVREKQKQILKRAHLKGLMSSVKLRAKAMGKVGLVFAAAGLATYGVGKALTSGKKQINRTENRVTKALLSRSEKNKRISIGLRKSTKVKNRRRR